MSTGLSTVNVAQVPQRSPFRYPGGKTWLVPTARAWLRSLRPTVLIEPFAGGGIISLTAAFERLVDRVVMVELDPHVAAVWHTILEGDAEWLANAILRFHVTPDNLDTVLAIHNDTFEWQAFLTIVRNRTARGGIMAPGAGRIKNGENGKGLTSRWYPETLSRRILDIAAIRDRITFIEGDGLTIMREFADDGCAASFIDPPYTASAKRAGSRLYLHSEIDHGDLFDLAGTLAGDFLMTYDNASELQTLSSQHGFDTAAVAMKNTHHAAMTELLISRSLGWLVGA